MTSVIQLKIITNATLKSLTNNIKENVIHYDDESFDEIEEYQRFEYPQKIDISVIQQLDPSKKDSSNAIEVYRCLNLSPLEAQDARIWVSLSHFEGISYCQKRWPCKNEIDLEAREKHINSHMMVDGLRGLFSKNAISRLWWAAYLCDSDEVKDYYTLEQALDIIFNIQQNFAATIERPNISRNKKIFSAILRAFDRHKLNNVQVNDLNKFINIFTNSIIPSALSDKEIDIKFDNFINYIK